jgi:hypothetical protein
MKRPPSPERGVWAITFRLKSILTPAPGLVLVWSAGLEVGRATAAAILGARENDGEKRTVQYTPGTKPGDYRPTPTGLHPGSHDALGQRDAFCA